LAYGGKYRRSRPRSDAEQALCQLLACTSNHQIQSCNSLLQSISACDFGARGSYVLGATQKSSINAELTCIAKQSEKSIYQTAEFHWRGSTQQYTVNFRSGDLQNGGQRKWLTGGPTFPRSVNPATSP
jgi:hypothetical protein